MTTPIQPPPPKPARPKPLTPRQAQVLGAIVAQERVTTLGPSLHDVRKTFGLASSFGISRHVAVLRGRGLLEPESGAGLVATPKGKALAARRGKR